MLFFCQTVANSLPLHEVSTYNAGRKLKYAVEASNNVKWKVQVSTAIEVSDVRRRCQVSSSLLGEKCTMKIKHRDESN